VNRGRLSLTDYVRLSSFNPAKIWGLYPRKGAIEPGADADMALVDLSRDHTIADAALQSRSKISPWNGRRVKGLPLHTLVRGRFVMKDRALAAGASGWGRSVHQIQRMPAPDLHHTDQTMEAIVHRGTKHDSETSTPVSRLREARFGGRRKVGKDHASNER
jgi:dihydroorotase